MYATIKLFIITTEHDLMAKGKTERAPNRDTYQRILTEIREGTLCPGDRLTETELAEKYGISRTPVREAIRQLEADGLISHTPRSGATLRQLDTSEISELYDMRAVLESTAARFAARAASDVEIDELMSIHEALLECTEVRNRYLLNQQFHRCLLDAARNRFLLRSAQSIDKTLLILGPSTLSAPSRPVLANQEHEQVLLAIRARDPEKAENAMRTHIESAHRARLMMVRKSQSEKDA